MRKSWCGGESTDGLHETLQIRALSAFGVNKNKKTKKYEGKTIQRYYFVFFVHKKHILS